MVRVLGDDKSQCQGHPQALGERHRPSGSCRGQSQAVGASLGRAWEGLGKGFLDKGMRKWAAQEVGFSREGAQLSKWLDQDQGPEG